ncbi:hypothetical protein BOTBODRAFT_428855 [Botryobasidium botryosum FD-172 SS1]|uniref:Uncharacterized protein n=1 Tax=Botryobasidium botryosum (strain FD-172 SS1) TaxID=930990 RepID=A0A067MJE1_BOTB1|nr:hypothetical protein BOTBODRAFT_428855 [Botryobasidium botryosum FD-172 SS1]
MSCFCSRVVNQPPPANDAVGEAISPFVPQTQAQIQVEETVEILPLSASNLPLSRMIGIKPKTYAALVMAGQSHQTQVSTRDAAPR